MKSLEETKNGLVQEAFEKIKADAQVPVNDQLKDALKEILDDAKVPMRLHLQVLEALGERVKQHEDTLEQHKTEREQSLALVDKHISHIDTLGTSHETERAGWEEVKNHLLSIEHLEGKPGKDANPVDEESLMNSIFDRVVPLIPEPVKGDPGEPGKDAKVDIDKIIKTLVQKLQTERILDLTHIKGAQGFVKDGVKYRFEELMHGSGRTSSGGTGYQAPTAGAVNGTNTVFTWATTPNVIVLDNGNAMNKVSADGTVNWTGTTTTTLNQAPNFNIYATA